MSLSAQQHIDSILGILEKEGISAAPVVEATDLATSYPDAVSDLAIAVMRRFPKGGTFLDGALSFMPQERWPELAYAALNILTKSREENHAAASIIEYASLQCPSALHSHLDQIFWIRPNADTYYECYPWRESGDQHFAFLKQVIEGSDSTDDGRRRAWTALFESRHSKLMEYAIYSSGDICPPDLTVQAWVLANLHLVGFHHEDQSLQRICPDSTYHLQFPSDFFDPQSRPSLAC